MNKNILSLAVVATLAFTTNSIQAHEKTPQPSKTLTSVLAAMPAETQARFNARHPQQTLDFFGIKPGMTVVEALPGGGWYSKVLLPYLGTEGKLIGADYPLAIFSKFGYNEERLNAKKVWVKTWTTEAETWRDANSAQVSAFQLGALPKEMSATADAVLFIRALHNLAGFENDGGFLSQSLKDTFNVLKPGGIVGIVQHQAAETSSDEWASGSNGYLKESFIKSQMKNAGFEFVASSEINLNSKDQPTEKDMVWRLPPSLATSKENLELKNQYLAIGESNRMTLLFKKPN